jgi:hypothetical protein
MVLLLGSEMAERDGRWRGVRVDGQRAAQQDQHARQDREAGTDPAEAMQSVGTRVLERHHGAVGAPEIGALRNQPEIGAAVRYRIA